MTINLVFTVLLFISFQYCSCQTRSEVETVYNTVFTNYSTYFRPIWNQSNPLTVNISFYLIAVNSFDEVEGVISLPGMFGLSWMDERLSWNPASYGNVRYLTVPQTHIWLPYIYLTSPSKGYHHIGDDEYMVKIFPTGMIVWMTGGIIKSTCTPDTTYFPFDTQNCTLTVVVFGYSPDEVRLSATAKVDLQFYVTNAEWELVSSVGYDELTSGTLPMSFAKFDVVIKRRPAYFVISILLPIIFLVLLNPLVYFLPIDSGERMSFCLTVLLSFAVFMTLVDDVMPKSSEPSIAFVSYYLLGTIVLSAFSTIATVFILAAYHKPDDQKVPAFIQCLDLSKNDLHQFTKFEQITIEFTMDTYN
ncbi:hypothetical protein KUTeg_004560 [Tegillarca granosa]|uniref:Uncharacterized protein n=1 Tax=Tegillarca granosa TaxID=220873 RepID=A0ABQ9FQ91_TEGGR|nr:hypothetical protein KUTeg_004560 [Tegillarca granosa]